jgi:hypothetical protein
MKEGSGSRRPKTYGSYGSGFTALILSLICVCVRELSALSPVPISIAEFLERGGMEKVK